MTKDRENQIAYAVFHETAELGMIYTGLNFTAQDGMEVLLNRGEITQEEYDWFKKAESDQNKPI